MNIEAKDIQDRASFSYFSETAVHRLGDIFTLVLALVTTTIVIVPFDFRNAGHCRIANVHFAVEFPSRSSGCAPVFGHEPLQTLIVFRSEIQIHGEGELGRRRSRQPLSKIGESREIAILAQIDVSTDLQFLQLTSNILEIGEETGNVIAEINADTTQFRNATLFEWHSGRRANRRATFRFETEEVPTKSITQKRERENEG